MRHLFLAAMFLGFACLPADAEFRTLVSNDGKAIKAELVSHAGGKVTIRREDGNEFEVDPAIFCKQDQAAIQSWMDITPAKIDYRLKPDATRKNTAKTEWSLSSYYEITLRNDGQDAVTGIKIMYRVLHENWGRQEVQEGEYLLEQELDFNRTLVLKSDTLHFSRSSSNRDSGLKGCLIRVLDPKGEVILDWVSNEVGMKDVTWETTNPKPWGAEPEKKVEIR